MILKINLNPIRELEDETKIISYDVNVFEENNGEKKCKQLEQKLNEQLNQQPINSEDGYVKACIFDVLYHEGWGYKIESVIFDNVRFGNDIMRYEGRYVLKPLIFTSMKRSKLSKIWEILILIATNVFLDIISMMLEHFLTRIF